MPDKFNDGGLVCRRDWVNRRIIETGRRLVKEQDDLLLFASELVSVLGRDARIKILYLLLELGELCPCDISDILCMSVQAVSDHLSRLRDKGVVETRREKTTVFYRLKPDWKKILQGFFSAVESAIVKHKIGEP